jgi:hypothetical protein
MKCEAPSRLPNNFLEVASEEEILDELFTPSRCGEIALEHIDYKPLGGGPNRKLWVCAYHKEEVMVSTGWTAEGNTNGQRFTRSSR